MRTDYLFAMPSLRSGAARVFDLFGVFDAYNDCPNADLADARAVYSDWRITGQDLADAMMVVGRERTTATRREAAASRTDRDA